MNKQNKDCEDCYRIKCKNCGWEPDEFELNKVQNGSLTSCPDCRNSK